MENHNGVKFDSSQFPALVTERLILRQLRNSDAVAISKLRSDDSVNFFIDRPKQTSVDGALAFIAKINGKIQEGNSFYWAICLKNNPDLIGTACLFNFSEDKSTAELGYELSPEYQRQGITSEAVEAVITFSFKNAGFSALEACVHKNHERSINLLLKNNFIPNPEKKEEKLPDYAFYILPAH